MNNNIELYNEIFIDVLGEDISDFTALKYKETEAWDSVAHITLVSEIEEKFDISFEAEEIFEFMSYNDGILILKNNYNIKL
ncbi:MAG: acyl carrier protein [bacterium]